MIKKAVSFGVALFAVALFAAGPSWSAVVGSRHDVNASGNAYETTLGALSVFGTCSACHIPHGAGADRLFPSAPSGVTGGFFGPLCASCHTSQGFSSGGADIWGNNSVYNADAHGLEIDTGGVFLTGLGNDYSLGSTVLNYLDAATNPKGLNQIECLSCHDVHNTNSNRPFLLVSLETLCQECHTNRVNNVLATTGYANPISTHPSGPLFTGDMLALSGVVTTGANSPIVLGPAIVANLDAGVGGSDWLDVAWNSGGHLEGGGVGCVTCHNVHWDDNTAPVAVTFFLGITPDNNGGANNAFCEYCHQGSNAGSAGLYFWNPGATVFSHPNDDVGSVLIDSSQDVTLPLGTFTTTSAQTGTGLSGIVCTSCHGVHRGDSTNTETEPNSPILLNYNEAAFNNVCDACHQTFGTGMKHHPIIGSYATAGNTAGGLTCQGGDTEGFNTCHGGSTNGGAAHNRLTSLAAGLDTNYSAMCVVCHTTNPSTYTITTPYTASGLASHFVGDADAAGFGARTTGATGVIRSAGVDTGLANWVGSGLPSKWGATAYTIICESCHRLANGNLIGGDGNTMMLLEASGMAAETAAASVAGAGGYTTVPYLCTGCHLIPSGTHPLADADGTAYAFTASTGQAYTTTGVTVNCESCHSPHDADTATGSYILDGGGTGVGTTGMEIEPVIDYTNFCAVCHGAI